MTIATGHEFSLTFTFFIFSLSQKPISKTRTRPPQWHSPKSMYTVHIDTKHSADLTFVCEAMVLRSLRTAQHTESIRLEMNTLSYSLFPPPLICPPGSSIHLSLFLPEKSFARTCISDCLYSSLVYRISLNIYMYTGLATVVVFFFTGATVSA